MPTRKQIIRQQVLAVYGKRCYYCGKYATGRALHLDHIVPRADKPANVDSAENLVPACKTCNLRKGKRALDAYILGRLTQLKAERDLLVQRYRERFPDE